MPSVVRVGSRIGWISFFFEGGAATDISMYVIFCLIGSENLCIYLCITGRGCSVSVWYTNGWMVWN